MKQHACKLAYNRIKKDLEDIENQVKKANLSHDYFHLKKIKRTLEIALDECSRWIRDTNQILKGKQAYRIREETRSGYYHRVLKKKK